MNDTPPLLSIQELEVTYPRSTEPAVRSANLHVQPSGRVGLVGESGSGKSTIAMAILGLLPAGATITGSIDYENLDLLTAGPDKTRAVRWSGISMIFQNSMTALNPVRRVGRQLEDAIMFHTGGGVRQARAQVRELFETVGLDPTRARAYPHELSGGMRQRVMVALALCCDPRLVIADEPTTALDVIMQRRVLDLLSHLQKERQLALILVSHDLAVVAETCDDIYVMQDGVIVEAGTVDQVLHNPTHDYTKALISSYQALEEPHADRTAETHYEGAPS